MMKATSCPALKQKHLSYQRKGSARSKLCQVGKPQVNGVGPLDAFLAHQSRQQFGVSFSAQGELNLGVGVAGVDHSIGQFQGPTPLHAISIAWPTTQNSVVETTIDRKMAFTAGACHRGFCMFRHWSIGVGLMHDIIFYIRLKRCKLQSMRHKLQSTLRADDMQEIGRPAFGGADMEGAERAVGPFQDSLRGIFYSDGMKESARPGIDATRHSNQVA